VKIIKGDTVIVISGEDKGSVGRVITIFPDEQRVLVEKVNMVKRHTKPRSQKQSQGGIIEKEATIHISNIALYDPKAKAPTRIKTRVRMEKDGNRMVKIKERISARTGEVIEKSTPSD